MKLPPLKALPVFEAAARLNSFSAAAEELSITQSAVSHQIKQLETYLGERLFWRSGRKVTLTDEGRQYLDAIGSALLQIERASEQLLGHEESRLRLSVFSSFAVRWLAPRLPDLQRLHPQIDLALEMSSENPVLSDRVADCFITIHRD
jgi:DNA-binding transcriptional LysR family regulator